VVRHLRKRLGAYAFYAENVFSRAMPVGLKKPNALGLHDMSGNVAEWVGAYYEKYPEAGRKPVYKDLTLSGPILLVSQRLHRIRERDPYGLKAHRQKGDRQHHQRDQEKEAGLVGQLDTVGEVVQPPPHHQVRHR
jgi:hypothetical protein